MSQPLTIAHLYMTDDGQSHFGSKTIDLALQDFAPPAAPFLVSDKMAAHGCVLVTLPTGWVGIPHPVPHRTLLLCLSGTLKLTASDGEVRLVRPGEVCLQEDLHGAGHQSETAEPEPVSLALVLM